MARSPPSGRFVQVDAGAGHSCGLRESDADECWGDDTAGESRPPAGRAVRRAGLHASAVSTAAGCWIRARSSAGAMTRLASRVRRRAASCTVSVSGEHSCGCWSRARSNAGALTGLASRVRRRIASAGQRGLGLQLRTCWRGAIECGALTGLASRVRRRVASCRSARAGITAAGSWSRARLRMRRPASGLRAGRFAQVSAGFAHGCGLLESGAVECWGRDGKVESAVWPLRAQRGLGSLRGAGVGRG